MWYFLRIIHIKKSLTQALCRPIIGVVPEHKNYTGTKNKQTAKNSIYKQPLLAGGCFLCSRLTKSIDSMVDIFR